MKHVWIVTLLISVVMAAGQGRDMPSFSFFDADGDGKITEQELNDGRAKRQDQLRKVEMNTSSLNW